MNEFSQDIVRQKLAQCAEALDLLKRDREIVTLEAFRADSNLYHAVCFRFITVIEALFEVGQVVLAERGKHATGEAGIGTLLARESIIPGDLAERLRSMYGFRNRLVHAYGTLDDAKVADYLSNLLSDIEEVLAALSKNRAT